MSKASTLLLYYCAVIALFLSASGFLTAKSTEGYAFQLLFLPITLYFVFAVVRNLKSRSLDVTLSGRTVAVIIFLIIFAILMGFAIRNILTLRGSNNEQVKSSQTVDMPESSDKDNVLIIKKEKQE